jgi:hypothetical protein
MWKRLHVKYRLFLSNFTETWIFSIGFQQKAQILSFIKIHPVGDKFSFHADRQTDITKLIVAFCNFANGHKIIKLNISFKLPIIWSDRNEFANCCVVSLNKSQPLPSNLPYLSATTRSSGWYFFKTCFT